jgi:dienelactone hydrolase
MRVLVKSHLLPVAAAALSLSSFAVAQADVTFPGVEIAGWGKVAEVQGWFGRASGTAPKAPAVLILHGSAGVDERGAFYARTLEQAGIATLQVTMFQRGGRPRTHAASMPYAAAGLKWLAAQPGIDAERLGVMGFSWGGVMTVLMSSEQVQEKLGKDVPRPVAFAPFYPVCTIMARFLKSTQSPFYDAHTRMSAAPMLIHMGTRDDYELGERPCDPLVAMWPEAARSRTTVRYVADATHAFDADRPRQFYEAGAQAGRGATIYVTPSPKDAAEARQAVVQFFVSHLKP